MAPSATLWERISEMRTVLVRIFASVAVGFVVCLVLDSYVIAILSRPLNAIQRFRAETTQLELRVGQRAFGTIAVSQEQFPDLEAGKDHVFQLRPREIDGEHVVALSPVTRVAAIGQSSRVKLHTMTPTEGFVISFGVAFFAGIILTAPFWIYSIASHVLPALHEEARKLVKTCAAAGLTLFASGVSLAYFVLLPLALHAAVQYSSMLGFDATFWRAGAYISFVVKFLCAMGVGFLFPIPVLVAIRLGLITRTALSRYRRHVFLISFVLGAVLTTPDLISQISLAVPMYVLFEGALLVAWYWERKAHGENASFAS